MSVLTQQPQGAVVVNRGNPLGRDLSFLWTGSNLFQDLTGDAVTVSSVNGQLIFGRGTERGITMFSTTSGTVQRTFTKTRNLNNSAYTTTLGVVFKVARLTGSGFVFGINNPAGFVQRIGINDTGYVTLEVQLGPSNPQTLVSDNAYTVGTWLSVVATVVSGSIIFYVNGVRQTQTSTSAVGDQTYTLINWGVSRGDALLCFVANVIWDQSEVDAWFKNPWQLLYQPQVKNKLLSIADFDDINAATTEPTTPVPTGSGIRQFLGQAMVNRGNQFGRNTQFLWSAATPRYDATDNYRATNSSDVTGLLSAGIFGEPPNITATSEGLQYTSTATPVGAGVGGGIVFRGKNTSSATGDWVAQPSGRGDGITVVILGRYTSTASNQRLFGWTNQQNSGSHDTFQIVAGNPRIQYPSSYLRTPNFAGTTTVPYTLGQVHLTVYVASWQGQFFYVDGKLAGQSGQLHYGGSLGPSARLAIVPGGMAPIMIAVINKPLTRQEVRQLTANPWQLYRQPRIRDQLLHTFIPDFTAELAPPSIVRSTYLTTPSSSDKNNAITSQLLFASSPAHGNTDGANAKIGWSTSSGIQVVPGRGGLAWVYGRAQSSLPVADSFNKPFNSTRWTMFSVLSLEVDNLAQITPGHYFSGPNWGGNVGAGTKLQINSDGKILLTTTGGTSIVADSVTITPRKVMVVAVTSDGTNTRFYLNGKLVHTSATVFDSGGSVTYQPQRISVTDSVAGTGLRPWYVYLSAMWTRPLQEHEIAKLSQDPYQLFKRPDTANHKILTGQYKYVETDANGRWTPYNERPTYVNYTDLPKTYVPVNKNHSIAKDMIFYSSPAHGFCDAYETDLIWNNPTNIDATGYNQALFQEFINGGYKKYGKAWHIGNKYSAKIASGTKLVRNVSERTLCAFIYINQDTYPIISFGDNFTSTTSAKSLINGGYTNYFDFGIRADGIPYFGYPVFGVVNPRGGSGGIIPLKQLVAVAVTVTGNLAKFYIDGKFIGEQSGAYGLGVDPSFRLLNNPTEVRHTSLEMYLAAGWDRALTPNEIADFSQHPGQIFQKQHLPREKLLERNFFTDLLPTYPSLPGITKLNRDDRGLYVPKFRVEAGRGADHNPLNTPAQWWYPTPSSGIYISTFDTTSQKGIYAGYAEARHTPYGIGLKTSGTYEFGSTSLTGDVYASKSVTLVSLFYLQNAKQFTINGRVTALNHRSATSTSLFAQYTNDIGWTNWAGERRVLFAPNRGQYGTGADAEITGVADGLHCAVMHINSAAQQVTCYFDGKLVATKALATNASISYNGDFHYNSYFESLSANNIGSILFASQLINQPFNSQQLSVLSKDPLPYFFKDSYQLKTDLLTKKLKYVETDDNGIWTPYNRQSTYVNTVALPKTYIPVNKNHPLTKTMLYCTTPAHGSRDAYNQEMIWTTRMELANNYTDWNSPYWHGVAARGGRAWQNKGYASRSTTYFKPPLILTSTVYTMLQFLSIETDSYPLAGEIPLMGHGYASANHLRIDKWGQLSLAYPYNGPSEIATVSGSRRVPLRRVVCVAATRTPSGTTLYIDGQKLGTVPQAPRWEVGGAADQFVHAVGTTGGGDNASISTHHVYMSAMWHRALSDQEIASLSQNPGQIFLHYERFKRIYPEATPEQFFNKFFLFFG